MKPYPEIIGSNCDFCNKGHYVEESMDNKRFRIKCTNPDCPMWIDVTVIKEVLQLRQKGVKPT